MCEVNHKDVFVSDRTKTDHGKISQFSFLVLVINFGQVGYQRILKKIPDHIEFNILFRLG